MTIHSEDSESGDGQKLAPVSEGELLEGKYVAGRQLGVGGMGVVIAARDQLLDRQVAIKFLLPSLANSERAVQRFIREARAASRITSEHVVRLLEISTLSDGTPFFVMEYLEGHDLGAMLADSGFLPRERAVDYLLQALEAIAEGHQRGVIHRDLKPGNLFVTRRADGTPLVKVLDFGIAKTLEPNDADMVTTMASDETRLGSPAYMSPEQLQNPGDVDVCSDVWAIGVTLYELLCGSHPFRANTYPDLVYLIRSVEPEPPSKRRPDPGLSPELDRVVLRCLAKAKSQRYATVREVAAALAPFGSEEGRASFKRIRGLTSRLGDEPLDVTTTLPGTDLDRSTPSSDRGREPLRSRRFAAAVVVGALTTLSLVGFALS